MLAKILERTRRGGTLILLGSAAGQAFDLTATVIFARLLGLKLFGVLIAARAITGIINALLTARSFELLLAFLPRFEQREREVPARYLYALCLRVELLLGLAGLGLAAGLGWLLPAVLPEASDSAWLLLLFVFLRHWGSNLINSNQAVFRLKEQYRISAVQAALQGFYRVVGLLIVLAVDGGLVACALVDGLAAAMSWATGAIIVRVKARYPIWLASWRPYREYAREFWRFSSLNWAASSAKSIAGYGAEVILLGLATAEAVGAFGLARKLAAFVSSLLDPLMQAVSPEIFRLAAEGETDVLRRFLARVTGYASVIVPVVAGALILGREPLTALIGGAEFVAASGPLVPLVIAFSVHFVVGWLRPLMLAFHQPKAVLAAQLAMGVVLIGGCFAFVPGLQATGAGLAMLFGYLAQTTVLGLAARRILIVGPAAPV